MPNPEWEKEPEMSEQIKSAVEMYLSRQARTQHPAGYFDGGGRWYPNEQREACSCCSHIRTPSRAWPYSLNKHCRSVQHVSSLCGVNATELRRAVRQAQAA